MKILRILVLVVMSTLVVSGFNVHAGSPASTDKTASNFPSVVLLIRHAEKPALAENSPHLSPTGVRRAQILPTLFIANGAQPPRFPRPEVLFATAASKHSNREVETILPLSQALRLPISQDFADEEFDAAAKEILGGKYAGKVVLVCWHHGKMPELAHALGANDAPAKIADDDFDQIWRIEWKEGKAQFTAFQQDIHPESATK
jgi:hypothetical protein